MKIQQFISTIFFLFVLLSCNYADYTVVNHLTIDEHEVEVKLEKSSYRTGEVVIISVHGLTGEYNLVLKDISEKGFPVLYKTKGNQLNWKISKNTPTHAIGLFIEDENNNVHFSNYFRVVKKNQLTTYQITKQKHGDVPVYNLDGGMSAEYAVQKSISNLTAGVSHTWEIGPGGGPNPVWGTPDFLERSVQYTVKQYDKVLGKNTPLKTVIISTGVPNIPYLSAVMQAPVLPLHFLVSVNACAEIQSILDYSSQNGYPAYATLGYDASMDHVGVAWIKLLDLPREYQQFIQNHQVENVIVAGIGENIQGESFARRVQNNSDNTTKYPVNSFYIQYTNHGSAADLKAISGYLVDYNEQQLDSVTMIADWESAVLESQVENMARKIHTNTAAQTYSLITPNSMIDMYDLAPRVCLEFIKKNNSIILSGGVSGVSLNEYLISNPVYELLNGKIPLLYWQFNPPATTIDRIEFEIDPLIQLYFPQLNPKDLKYHVNARIGKKELVSELKRRNYQHVTMRLDNVEEVWDMTDGVNAPAEFIADDINQQIGFKKFMSLVKELTPITIDDLIKLSSKAGDVRVKKVH